MSHDRAFLDNVVTQTVAAEGGGTWREYVGGYSDWLTQSATRALEPPPTVRAPVPPVAKSFPARERGSKLSWKEQRELESLPDRIADLEGEQKDIALRLEDPDLYRRDPQGAQTAAARLVAIDDELIALLERWENLEGRGGVEGA